MAPSFEPSVLHTLVEVFESAWQSLESEGRVPAGSERAVRDLLAKRIIACAQTGEKDFNRLKAYALGGFEPAKKAPGDEAEGRRG